MLSCIIIMPYSVSCHIHIAETLLNTWSHIIHTIVYIIIVLMTWVDQLTYVGGPVLVDWSFSPDWTYMLQNQSLVKSELSLRYYFIGWWRHDDDTFKMIQ